MKPTQEQVTAWAREVWGDDSGKPWSEAALLHITQLATLAYEAGQESMKWDGIHSCHPDCQRPACVHTRKAVEAEREACAKVCREPEIEKRHIDCGKPGCAVAHYSEIERPKTARECAAAIRARREQ